MEFLESLSFHHRIHAGFDNHTDDAIGYLLELNKITGGLISFHLYVHIGCYGRNLRHVDVLEQGLSVHSPCWSYDAQICTAGQKQSRNYQCYIFHILPFKSNRRPRMAAGAHEIIPVRDDLNWPTHPDNSGHIRQRFVLRFGL